MGEAGKFSLVKMNNPKLPLYTLNSVLGYPNTARQNNRKVCDVGFPSVCYEYVLLPSVIKEVVSA